MFVEEVQLENIKCFEKVPFRFASGGQPHRWVTLLGENGGGKSTVLQALALLLAGPESAQKLCPRPVAWLRDEGRVGKMSVRVHQDEHDSGQFGSDKVSHSFGYSFHVTGSRPLELRRRPYSEPAIVENPEKRLTWLRKNAFGPTSQGWFAAGYGPFRRLTREDRVLLSPSERPARYENFLTQFNEDEPLSTFEKWLLYLDYQTQKDPTQRQARRDYDLAVEAVNHLLPDGTAFDSVTSEGRICFRREGRVVPTSSLSDGFRSVLAVAGDLVWRLLAAFPDSDGPLRETGVVLIDELDIHLHPSWQREIPGYLRGKFPNLQFIVATHSPLIALGAGDDALALRLVAHGDTTEVQPLGSLSALDADRALRSPAFGLVSTYSPETQERLEQYQRLRAKGARRTRREDELLGQLTLFFSEAQPYGLQPEPGSLEARIDEFLEKTLR